MFYELKGQPYDKKQFAPSETGGELETKFTRQLFLGLLLGTRWSAIGQFFSLTLVTVPEVFAKVNSAQFPSLLKLHVKLDWCCIELHHGSVLGTLPLLSLVIGRLRRKLVKTLSTKTDL